MPNGLTGDVPVKSACMPSSVTVTAATRVTGSP